MTTIAELQRQADPLHAVVVTREAWEAARRCRPTRDRLVAAIKAAGPPRSYRTWDDYGSAVLEQLDR